MNATVGAARLAIHNEMTEAMCSGDPANPAIKALKATIARIKAQVCADDQVSFSSVYFDHLPDEYPLSQNAVELLQALEVHKVLFYTDPALMTGSDDASP